MSLQPEDTDTTTTSAETHDTLAKIIVASDQPALPQIIPWRGPSTSQPSLIPPFLTEVEWKEIKTLSEAARVVVAPWGTNYQIKSDQDEDLDLLQARAEVFFTEARFRVAQGTDMSISEGIERSTDLKVSEEKPKLEESAQSVMGSYDQGDPLKIREPLIPTVFASAELEVLRNSNRSKNQGGYVRSQLLKQSESSNHLQLAVEVPGTIKFPDPSQLSLGDWFIDPISGTVRMENARVFDAKKLSDRAKDSVTAFKSMVKAMAIESIQSNDSVQQVLYSKSAVHHFQLVLNHAPAEVFLEAIVFESGVLLPDEWMSNGIRAVAKMLARPGDIRFNEITYPYAIAAWLARVLEAKITATQGKQDELEQAIDSLIKTAIKEGQVPPATTVVPPNEPAKGLFERRIKIAEAAIVCALVLSGGFALLHNQQVSRQKRFENAKLAISLILACVGFAPIPAVGSAASVASVLAMKGLDWWEGKAPDLQPLWKARALQQFYWPLLRERQIKVLGWKDVNPEDISEFQSFFELTLGSAQVGW